MNSRINDDISTLGLSRSTCNELRSKGINTILALMIWIESELQAEPPKAKAFSSAPIKSKTDLRRAILDIMMVSKDTVYNDLKMRKALVMKFGSTFDNIAAINNTLFSLAYTGEIDRVSQGKYKMKNIPHTVREKAGTNKNPHHAVPLEEGIASVLDSFSDISFDCGKMQELLFKKYRNDVSLNKESIRTVLQRFVREGKLTIDGQGNFAKVSEKHQAEKPETFDDFLKKNIGKTIEFRYKTRRKSSDKRWRQVKIWDVDSDCFYISERYPSGRRIAYQKKLVVEYREV